MKRGFFSDWVAHCAIVLWNKRLTPPPRKNWLISTTDFGFSANEYARPP